MDRDEWLRVGVEQGYCSHSLCIAHDTPFTDEEAQRFELGLDPCVPGVRLLDGD